MTALYVVPTLLVIALLASRRVALLHAGLAGLVATLVAAGFALAPENALPATLLRESLAGAWLSWQAIAVILAGLFFHHVAGADPGSGRDARAETDSASNHRRLFTVCFFLGPFFEAATGFGVGLVIVVPVLMRLGLDPLRAAVFGLFSQMLVPWGAMAIGSTVGAGLAGLSTETLGVHSVAVAAPLLLGYLGVFWLLSRRAGQALRPVDCLDDLAWTLALVAALYLTNRFLALEAGALVSCGVLLALRYLRDERHASGSCAAEWRQAAPYVALTALVLATRAVPPLESVLQTAARLEPLPGQPGFGPFHHVSMLILAVAVGNGLVKGLPGPAWRRVLAAVWRDGRKPVAVTFVFVIMGQLTGASGMAAAMTESLVAAAGGGAVMATPVMAGLGGFLTGSNVAANAISMPLQVQIAAQTGLPLTWLAALQNVAGSNLTLLSPIRIAMAAALIRVAGAEAEIYRRAQPILVMLAVALFAAAALVWMGGR